jgi:hypothetical protein
MTLTRQKLEANQRNARKSTGPKTPDGKAASKLNANVADGAKTFRPGWRWNSRPGLES